MTKITVAEPLFSPPSAEMRFLPEGPTALGTGKFSWVAIQHGETAKNGSLNIFDMGAGTNHQYVLPGRPGFAKPTTREGKFVLGCERELGIFDLNSGMWEVLSDDVDTKVQGTIINDATVYADNIVFGTKDVEFATAKAGLYLFRGRDRQLIQLRDDQICSNGKDIIDLAGGGLALIDIDSPTKKVVRYSIDIDNGTLGEAELIVDLTDLPGVPDGMTVSPDEQSLIISFYNPNPAEFGETRQYSLYNGALEHIWRTPLSPQNTCPLLIESEDGNVKLIITTAIEHMPEERQKSSIHAGCIFVADTSFTTSPPTPRFPVA